MQAITEAELLLRQAYEKVDLVSLDSSSRYWVLYDIRDALYGVQDLKRRFDPCGLTTPISK